MIEVLLIGSLVLSIVIFERLFQLGWGIAITMIVAVNFSILALSRLVSDFWVSPMTLAFISTGVLAGELLLTTLKKYWRR